jgi:type IV pilus assembly protein PilX
MNQMEKMMRSQKRHSLQQRGAALITSLIILLVLTVLGVSAMSTSSLEELMAGNLRDQNLSFQAAEAALQDGERHIDSWGNTPPKATSDGANEGLYSRDEFGLYEYTAFDTDNTWNNAIATTYGADTGIAISNLGEVSALPMYIIEEEDFVAKDASFKAQTQREGAYYYRVTARGVGASSNAVTLLQSTVARRYK